MSSRIATVTIAATVLVGTQLATALPARAIEGVLCSFTSVDDPTSDNDVRTATLEGGPVSASSTDPSAPSLNPTASISISCSLRTSPYGTGAEATASGIGVAYLPPTPVSYVAPSGTALYLCTAVTVDGTTYYPDDEGGWSTDPAHACALLITTDPGPGPAEELRLLAEAVLCPILASAFGTDGDVYGPAGNRIWDCPPYAG